MDFNEQPVLKAKKRGIKRLLSNIKKRLHIKSKAVQLNSSITFKNFYESQIDEKFGKRLTKFFSQQGGSVKEVSIVNSSFDSVGSFKKFLAFFANLEKINLSNVGFNLKTHAGVAELVLDKLQAVIVTETDLRFLPALSHCFNISELDIQLLESPVLQEVLLKEQMVLLEIFLERQTRLERFRLENVSYTRCFLKFFPNVDFRLKELSLRNVYFASAKLALHFVRSQHEIQELELKLAPSRQESGYYGSYGELEEVLMHIYENCHRLKRLKLDLLDYHYFEGSADFNRSIANDSLEQLKIRQEGVFHDVGLIDGLLALSPKVKHLTYEDKMMTFQSLDLSSFNNLEELQTLSLQATTHSLNTINMPQPCNLEVVEFKPKFLMKKADDERLLKFLKRHPSIEHATIHIHMDLEMMYDFVKIRPCGNLVNLILDSFQDVGYSVMILKKALPNLENIELQQMAVEDLTDADHEALEGTRITHLSLFDEQSETSEDSLM